MRLGACVLLSVAALSRGVDQFAVLTCGPTDVDYVLGSTQVASALKEVSGKLGVNITHLAPHCGAPCASLRKQLDEEAFETVWNASWQNNLEAREAAVAGYLTAGGKAVVTIGCEVSTGFLKAHASAAFVQVHTGWTGPDEVNVTRSSNGNAVDVYFTAASAAYMNGALAGVLSRQMNKRVAVVSTAGCPDTPGANRPCDDIRAFVQGITDAAEEVCVMRLEVTETADPVESFGRVAALIREELAGGIDFFYSRLGLLDTAVLAAVRNRSITDYEVGVITGSFSGWTMELQQLDTVRLSADIVDYVRFFTAVFSNKQLFFQPSTPLTKLQQLLCGRGGEPIQVDSQWTSAATTAPPAGPLMQEETERTCPAVAQKTYLQVISKIQSVVNSGLNTGRARYRKALLAPIKDWGNTTCKVMDPPVVAIPATSEAVAECVALDPEKTVRLVGVGIYMVNLGSVDLKTGSFYVDFNMYLHQSKTRYASPEDAQAALGTSDVCTSGSRCKCPEFAQNEWEDYVPRNQTSSFESIVNMVNIDRLSKITPVMAKYSTGVRVDFFRMQANFFFSPELHHWPLDTQLLSIRIEDMLETNTNSRTVQFCHMEQFAGLAPGARYFPGMELSIGTRPWKASLSSSCWPSLAYPEDYAEGLCSSDGSNDKPVRYPKSVLPDGLPSCACLGGTKASSRYEFSMTFTRPVLNSYMKTLLPPLFILLVNQGAWFLHPRVFETRLGVCGSSLVSCVMYHVSLTSNTPDTSVLTWADRFMTVVYFNNLLSFFFVFLQTVFWQAKLERLARVQFGFTRVWGPLVAIAGVLGGHLLSTLSAVITLQVSFAAGSAVLAIIARHLLRDITFGFVSYWKEQNEAAEVQYTRLSSEYSERKRTSPKKKGEKGIREPLVPAAMEQDQGQQEDKEPPIRDFGSTVNADLAE